MACEQVRFSVDHDGIATITLDDPQSRNALSNDVIKELDRLLKHCEDSEDVRIVMLRGSGGAFSSGGNIRTLKEQIDTQSWDRSAVSRLCDAARRLKDLTKPTICVIEGTTAGAGVSLAMLCDFSIAVESAKFTCAFINLALVPDTGCTQLLLRTAGVCRAKELLFTGKVFSAREAQEWGIITQAVPQDELEDCVAKLIRKLQHTSPSTYCSIKTLINRSAYPDFELNLLGEGEYQNRALRSADHAEGVCAFLEKRAPSYR